MVSLDGFAAGANGELDWGVIDEELHTFINHQLSEIGIHLCGRRLYEVMRYWETADQNPASTAYELEFAKIWQGMLKIVFSSTLQQVQGNTRLAKDDVVAEIRQLKQQPGQDIEVGGPTLASACIKAGLIDEYRLFIHPVVLGDGLSFFPALDGSINLRLVETRRFESGVVYLRYQHVE